MRLRDRLSGETFILISATLFAVSNIIMKLAVEAVPALQVMWIRFSFAAVLLALAGWMGLFQWRVERPWILVVRGLSVTLGALCSFPAVGLTSFGNFSVLVYTNPIFGTLISRWWFGERFTFRDAGLLALTFTGIVLIMRPGWHGVNLGDVLALTSGLLFGIALAVVKEAAKTESVWLITLSFYVTASLLSGPAVFHQWQAVTVTGVALVVGLMVVGTTAQLCETAGYRKTTVAVGGTLSYWTVVLSIVLGAWVFHEPLRPSFFAGAALIVGCGVYALRGMSPPFRSPAGKD